ncbi:MAG: hypothetical protein AAF755_14595 [Pseudomonadota bacterium]
MAKYHPIDVRYKGPSTAYTGSAKKKQMTNPVSLPDAQSAKKPSKPKAPMRSNANPWNATQRGMPGPAPRPAQPHKPATQMPLAMRLLLPWPLQFLAGMLRRLGWGWSLALLYLIFTFLL